MRVISAIVFLFGFVALAQPPRPLVPESEIMALNDNMRAYLTEHLKDYHGKESILKKLIEIMFDEEYLHIQYQGGITKTAVEVFETRQGNCLGFTSLFIAMAREAGLSANYQQVYTIPHWGRQNQVVIQNRHVNARVWINNIPYTVDFYPEREKREFHQRVLRDEEAIAQFYNNLGVEAFAEDQYEYAQANFERAFKYDDGISFIWTNYGALQRNQGKYEDAEDSYKRALRLNRYDYTAMSNLAKLYKVIGENSKATRWEARSERHMKRNPYYHFFKGEEAYLVERFEDAVAYYERAVDLNDTDHELHFALARGYYRLGESEKAAKSLRRAQELASIKEDATRYKRKLQTLLAVK